MIYFLTSPQGKMLVMSNYWLFFVLIVVFGAIFGSFFDMLTYRLPNNLSIIKPSSFCPVCKTPLKWYNNIPIFSYIFQRGKCASCGVKIPARYLLLEITTPLLCLGVFHLFLIAPYMNVADLFKLESLMLLSIPIFVIDAKHKVIPIVLTIIGAIIALAMSPLSLLTNFQNALIGLIIGAFAIFIIRFFANRAYQKEAMGEGDIWLMGMLTAYCGWFSIPLIMLVSSISGVIVGLFYIKILKSKEIPFGPFLIFGAWTYIIVDYLLGKDFLVALFSKISPF